MNSRLIEQLSDEERRELDEILAAPEPVWQPAPGNNPQKQAYDIEVDVLGFGGAAGGGKTELGLGLALTKHKVCQVFRREGTEMRSIIDRVAEILGHRDGLGGKPAVWRNPTPTCEVIEFGSMPHLADRTKYQGRAKDFLWFDEAANFLEDQVRFLMGWVRSATGHRCMTLLTFNPPTTSDGLWIIDFFGPWLDPKHPEPAEPGEIRWFASVKGEEYEVEDSTPFVVIENDDGEEEWTADFDPADYKPEQIIRPQSRTFVPSRVSDNPYLGASYYAQLQSLPEPLRSQMLEGDFHASMEDDPYQVIPTKWIEEAMERWEKPKAMPEMDSMGVDVALGGRDKTVIICRHGSWFSQPVVYEGRVCKDGKKVAGYIIAEHCDNAVIHIDLFGVGAQPYGELMRLGGVQVVGCDVGQPARGLSEDGNLLFFNWRSELWWRVREALDPRRARVSGIALPKDRKLLADLAAPKWELSGRTIRVESRDKIVERIGRSPDYGSAMCLAMIDTLKVVDMPIHRKGSAEYDPYADI